MIKLYNGDCSDILKSIPDGSVGLILQDAPYNTTACKWEWDIMTKIDEFWSEWNRIIKPNGAIVMFGSEPFSSKLRLSNLKMYKYDWIWEKSRPMGFLEAKNKPMKKHEIISVFSFGSSANGCKNRITYNPQGLIKVDKKIKNGSHGDVVGYRKSRESGTVYNQEFTNYPNSLLKFESIQKPVHPTQKPVALMEYLIKTYTNEGETVFDGFMGSGTTGVACKNLNRNFIGIELDEKYFNIAKERIGN